MTERLSAVVCFKLGYLSVIRSCLASDSLRPSSQSQIALRFGYKYATGIFALRVAPLKGEP